LGKGGAKRHRKVLRDTIYGITKPAIRRLARRGGVKRISELMYEETRGILKSFLEDIIKDTVALADHRSHPNTNFTICLEDVLYALKRANRPLYGVIGSRPSVPWFQKMPLSKSKKKKKKDDSSLEPSTEGEEVEDMNDEERHQLEYDAQVRSIVLKDHSVQSYSPQYIRESVRKEQPKVRSIYKDLSSLSCML